MRSNIRAGTARNRTVALQTLELICRRNDLVVFYKIIFNPIQVDRRVTAEPKKTGLAKVKN